MVLPHFVHLNISGLFAGDFGLAKTLKADDLTSSVTISYVIHILLLTFWNPASIFCCLTFGILHCMER